MRVTIASSLGARLRGLHGLGRADSVLLLVPCRDIHTFTMDRSIDVAFLDADGVVVESHERVAPLSRLKCAGAVATLERFSCEEPWVVVGDRLELERRIV